MHVLLFIIWHIRSSAFLFSIRFSISEEETVTCFDICLYHNAAFEECCVKCKHKTGGNVFSDLMGIWYLTKHGHALNHIHVQISWTKKVLQEFFFILCLHVKQISDKMLGSCSGEIVKIQHTRNTEETQYLPNRFYMIDSSVELVELSISFPNTYPSTGFDLDVCSLSRIFICPFIFLIISKLCP